LALDDLARRRRFRRPLDIGTGSGVLAIAAAKRLHRQVVAGDIDPQAVRVARHHARRNGLAGTVRVVRAAGYRSRGYGAGITIWCWRIFWRARWRCWRAT